MAKNTHTSLRGKTVDMSLLQKKNELTPAVGNARVNARGDTLGAGNKIIKTREQILADYQNANPGVPDELAVARSKNDVEQEKDALVIEDEWVEDDDGNFVAKEK